VLVPNVGGRMAASNATIDIRWRFLLMELELVFAAAAAAAFSPSWHLAALVAFLLLRTKGPSSCALSTLRLRCAKDDGGGGEARPRLREVVAVVAPAVKQEAIQRRRCLTLLGGGNGGGGRALKAAERPGKCLSLSPLTESYGLPAERTLMKKPFFQDRVNVINLLPVSLGTKAFISMATQKKRLY